MDNSFLYYAPFYYSSLYLLFGMVFWRSLFFYLVDAVKKIKNILFGSVFFVISKSFSTTLINHQVSFSCLSNSRLNSSQSLICSQKIIFHWMVATMIHLKIIFWWINTTNLLPWDSFKPFALITWLYSDILLRS